MLTHLIEKPAAPADAIFSSTAEEKQASIAHIDRRYTLPNAREFGELISDASHVERPGYLWLLVADNRGGCGDRRVGTCYVQPTAALQQAIAENMLIEDPHKFVKIIILNDDTARVFVDYNHVIGGMWTAIIDPRTIPTLPNPKA